MNSLKRVPWDWVTDARVIAWSAPELIVGVEHELVQKATHAFAVASNLAVQEGYGFTNEDQKRLIGDLYPKTKHFLGVAYWMTIWLLAQDGRKPYLTAVVQEQVPAQQQDSITRWSAEELISNVYAEMASESTIAREISSTLSSGTLGYTGREQSEVIAMLHAALERLDGVVERIGLWLSEHRLRREI